MSRDNMYRDLYFRKQDELLKCFNKAIQLQERVKELENAIKNHFEVVQIPTSSLLPTEKILLDLVKDD
jgi:hypothetical protein